MDPLLRSVYQVLEHGRNTNSYKFALLRALADGGQACRHAGGEVSLEWLAEKFVGYYWPLTTVYRVRQSIDPAKEPVVMGLIRDLVARRIVQPRQSVGEFARRDSKAYGELVRRVARTAFGDVIPRFHNLRRGEVSPRLYEDSEAGISVPPSSSEFLSQHADLLRFMAVSAWVRFTQDYTAAPKLFEKISDRPPNRKTASYRGPLRQVETARCFYCEATPSSIAVDHVIPWSYVLEDRAWNLVFACPTCNGSKSDGVPEADALERLIQRNSAWMASAERLPARLAKDLKEWGSPERLEEHVRTLREQAHQDGFPSWSGRG